MKKKNLPPTGMAARYELAWNGLVNELPNWKKAVVIDDPLGRSRLSVRINREVAHEAAELAERTQLKELNDLFEQTFHTGVSDDSQL